MKRSTHPIIVLVKYAHGTRRKWRTVTVDEVLNGIREANSRGEVYEKCVNLPADLYAYLADWAENPTWDESDWPTYCMPYMEGLTKRRVGGSLMPARNQGARLEAVALWMVCAGFPDHLVFQVANREMIVDWLSATVSNLTFFMWKHEVDYARLIRGVAWHTRKENLVKLRALANAPFFTPDTALMHLTRSDLCNKEMLSMMKNTAEDISELYEEPRWPERTGPSTAR